MDRLGIGPLPGAPQAGTQVEMPPLLEGMSIVMAAERGTAELYRRYALETLDTTLKRQWDKFGSKAQVHVRVTEGVIAALRGDPAYRSPGAAEVDKCTELMLSLAIQGEQADLLRLGRLISVEQVSMVYWRGVNAVAAQTRDPSLTRILRQAATTVERDKSQHLSWNSGMLQRYVQKVMTGR